MLEIPPLVAWSTPLVDLDFMLECVARRSGKPFQREMLPQEQEAKAEGLAFARRLEQARKAKGVTHANR